MVLDLRLYGETLLLARASCGHLLRQALVESLEDVGSIEIAVYKTYPSASTTLSVTTIPDEINKGTSATLSVWEHRCAHAASKLLTISLSISKTNSNRTTTRESEAASVDDTTVVTVVVVIMALISPLGLYLLA
jgi:hypothetical protein